MALQLQEMNQKIGRIKENIGKVMIGKTSVIDLVLTSLIAGGHVLLEDVPGTGKTVLAKSLAKSVDSAFSRIQFTPDLLPTDITGLNYFNQKEGEFVFREGPVFCHILLADEINRATPRTQSSLLECMEEKQVTIDGVTHVLERPFFVIATQNPVETAGTYPLPEAQLDRFLMQISMGTPDKEEEIAIMKRFLADNPLEELVPVCTGEDIIAMQNAYKEVFIHTVLMGYIADLVAATRTADHIVMGVSPRGTLAILNAARAYAMVCGRDFVTPEDIKALAVPVLAHRLILQRGGSRSTGSAVMTDILDQVPVPTEDWSR
ncbi:MAG: MoxR family ATPase [Lachnospiraceae bacterium]|jgi:MoxR-like ATPase|nr:MoxR family ATPase [Lachnospiraceae bacterium]MCX4316565.1 MoxR family ATPase [Lachnospiraceae bacterium]